ncbi:MAG: nitroreductase family protein [Bacteroidales bacterium]|nr:nitroreductase family protein [Bacteroidales bacterium]MCF8336890.1 nitroreductase family protein [Bacteroidales bacterium]
MKTFLDLVRHRQSTRKYKNEPVPREHIEKCIETARLAPSASNSQPWKFIVVDEPELKDKVAKHTYDKVIKFNKFADKAPAMVVITLETPKTITRIGRAIKKKEWPLIDIGIAAEHFCLQADELGLGTCMIGWFNERKVQKLLDIPAKRSIALLLSVGYPPEDYKLREKKRKSLEEIVAYNSYKKEGLSG